MQGVNHGWERGAAEWGSWIFCDRTQETRRGKDERSDSGGVTYINSHCVQGCELWIYL